MPKYRFDEIAINSTEKKKPTDEDKETYIGLEHLDSGSLYVKRWGSSVPIKGEKLVMRKGDVLLGKRNAYLRRAAIAPHDGIFSAHGMVLRPKEDVIDRDFFPLFIASDYFFDTAVRISVGSLSPTVNWKDLKVAEFELPSLEEQRKLAKALWAVIRTIEAYKELIEKTDELVKSQFIEMSVGAKGVPTRMGDIASYINGAAFKPSDWSSTGKPIIRIQNLNDISAPYNYFSGELDKKYEVHTGDVLISWATHLEAYIWSGGDAWLNQHIFRVDFNKGDINKLFFIHAANVALKEAFKKAHGFKATMEHIKRNDFEESIVFVPDITVQEQFAAFVRQTDKSKFELTQALEALNATYKKLISENLG